MTDNDVLDPDGLQALRDLAGPDMPEIVTEVVTLYIDTSAEAYAAMKTASAAGDAKEVREMAHKIKGSSGNVGARVVGEHALTLERAAAGGDPSPEAVEALGPALDASYAALRAEFDL